MTSITLTITGAKAKAVVNGPLTSGMVGIPVTINYDGAWDGLTKNLVCRCGLWGPDRGETRTVLDIGETATVAHEVMKADMHLYLGIEGYSADGKLVMPTTWAECGKIQCGANTTADPSANPKLSIWSQLQADLKKIQQHTVTTEQIVAAVGVYLEENPIVPDSSQNTNGLSAELKTAMINYYTHVMPNFDDTNGLTYVNAILSALGAETRAESGGEEEPDTPDVTLTSISATYSGGDVAAGTAVTELTGVVVKAHYSDGTSETVTGYTLNGTIAEGENTVTVTYQGKTAAFTVTGVSESGEDSDGFVYDVNYWELGYYINASGAIVEQSGAIGGQVYRNIPVKAGQTVTVTSNADLGVVIARGVYDGNGFFFNGAGAYLNSGTNYTASKTAETDGAIHISAYLTSGGAWSSVKDVNIAIS